KVLYACIVLLVFSFFIYGVLGHGTMFFPESEPEFASIHVKARGEMSLVEKDRIARDIESRILGSEGVKSYYTTVFAHPPGQASADTIAIIRMELLHWKQRSKAAIIFEDLRNKLKGMAGVIIEVRAEERGPASGRDIELELSAQDYRTLLDHIDKLVALLENTEGLIDIQDSRPPPGYEWQLSVDREKASQFG